MTPNKAFYIQTKGLNTLMGVKSTVIVNASNLSIFLEKLNLEDIKHICIGIEAKNNRIIKRGILSKVNNIKKLSEDTLQIGLEGIAIIKFKDNKRKDIFSEVEFDIEWEEYKEFEINFEEMSILQEKVIELYKNSITILDELSSFKGKDFILALACTLKLTTHEISSILSTTYFNKIYEILLLNVENELFTKNVELELDTKVKSVIDKDQRQYFLRKKMEVLQSELNNDGEDSNDEYSKKINKAKLPAKLKEKLLKEAAKLTKMPEFSAESNVIRNYLDIILDLPWNIYDKTSVDILKAKEILDKEHYALKEPKDNVLDYLAYLQKDKLNDNKHSNSSRPTILCLVGPPGIGKTSFAESIANSINRKFTRIALGGVSDESEIRGHRRTYVGAMPGRIIDAVKRTKTSNPVILLDEIDKLSYQYKGDPSSALLEVLDPEQNKSFEDRFVDYPFDLSKVFFICTANDARTIPAPLYDRMEIIYLDSYTDKEKLEISKKYILPELENNTGIEIKGFNDENLLEIIHSYTREAGVRNLKRLIEKIYKKVIRIKLETEKKDKKYKLTKKDIRKFLGVEKYRIDKLKTTLPKIGNVIGLAWTSVGGTALEVQAVKLKGKGKLILTGKLGDVMKESAQVSHSYIRSVADKYNIVDEFYEKNDIHLHFPEGAVPKDGPSAGITITSAMLSVLTNRPVRQDVAMTGEITIAGEVLPIGGVKEKLIGAINIGATEVILPYENKKDYEEVSDDIKKKLKVHFVKEYDEVEKILF